MEKVSNLKIPTMLTIKETAKATGMSEYYIRGKAKSGEIVRKKSGNKFLINLEKFIDFLDQNDIASESEKPGKNRFNIKPIAV